MKREAAAMGLVVCLVLSGCGGGGGGGKKRRPPVLDPIPTPQSVQMPQSLHFQVTASDADGDTLTLTAAPLPPNASFVDNGNNTGDFDFTPDILQIGQIYTVTFTADDGVLAPDTQDVVIEVTGGAGNGTFTRVGTGPVVDYGTEGWGIDGGDFDMDGNVDLAVTDRDPAGITAGFCILLGDGTGQFTMTPESPYACGTGNPQPRFAEVGDFDEDGALDVAVGAVNEGTIYVFMGDGGSMPDGTFTEHPGSPLIVGDVMHLDSADFDEDGHLDLVVGAYGSTNVYVLLGDGTGAFTASAQSPLDAMPGGGGLMHVSIGDFTNDGILDFLTSHWQDTVYNLFIGDDAGSGVNSNATFTSPLGAVFSTVTSPGLAVTGDYNGDGNLDFIQEGWNTLAEAAVMLGDGAGVFTEAPGRLSVGDACEYGAASDFNGDTITDVVFASVWSDQFHVYLGDGTGAFSYAPGSPIFTGRAPRVIYLNDFNHDLITDIATAFQSNGELYIYLGN